MPYYSLHEVKEREKIPEYSLPSRPLRPIFLSRHMTSMLQLTGNDHAKHMNRAVVALEHRDMIRFQYHVDMANKAFEYYNKLCPLGRPETKKEDEG